MRNGERYLHVLATRLGIGVYDEAWFDYRLRLFESITVPSMLAQTDRDFWWLVVVDRAMPPRVRQRVDRILSAVDRAVVLEVELKSDFKPEIVKWAKEKARQHGRDYVLSSRLDDDDALRVDFFERLRGEADEFLRRETWRQRRAVFSFTLGTMWLPSHGVGYTRYHDSHSLGLAVMEPIDVHKSVYHWTHTQIKQSLAPQGAYIRGVDGDDVRWWLYAAHPLAVTDRGDNARFRKVFEHKYRYTLDDDLLKSFGLDPASIARLAAETVPRQVGNAVPLSQRAKEVERRIKELRAKEAVAGMLQRRGIRRELKSLEDERREAGTNVVAGSA